MWLSGPDSRDWPRATRRQLRHHPAPPRHPERLHVRPLAPLLLLFSLLVVGRATGTRELEDRLFATLSAGEKQRLVIASA